MRARQAFTIVELLIVIVVIAILAAITIVAYSGIQQNVRNSARVTEAREWQKIFTAYKATYGVYPYVGTGAYCLGEGFADVNGDTVGDCWDAWNGATNIRSEAPTINAEARKIVSTLPNATRVPVKGDGTTSRLGPAYEGSSQRILYWIEGTGSCPIGTPRWMDTISRACQIQLD